MLQAGPRVSYLCVRTCSSVQVFRSPLSPPLLPFLPWLTLTFIFYLFSFFSHNLSFFLYFLLSIPFFFFSFLSPYFLCCSLLSVSFFHSCSSPFLPLPPFPISFILFSLHPFSTFPFLIFLLHTPTLLFTPPLHLYLLLTSFSALSFISFLVLFIFLPFP